MGFASASTFANLEAYTAATTTQEEGLTVPVLERFVIARGELPYCGPAQRQSGFADVRRSRRSGSLRPDFVCHS